MEWWQWLMIAGFGLPLAIEYLNHRQKMGQLQVQLEQAQQTASEEVSQQVEALRKELADFRQTSTEYSLSLDNTLQQVQARLSFVERQVKAIEHRQEVRP